MENTQIARIKINLKSIAELADRLKGIGTDEHRDRLLVKYNGDRSCMYAELFGAAEVTAQMMAADAARIAAILEGK